MSRSIGFIPRIWRRARAASGWRTVDGIVVPGGFGYRGIEGKIVAAQLCARTQRALPGPVPGHAGDVHRVRPRTCWACDDANSTEFDHATRYPVIDLMPEQRDITDMGGTMRLGIYPCALVPGTRAANSLRRRPSVHERHRHRFEFNNAYREMMRRTGWCFSGLSPDGRLVEIAELADHPFMVGSQFHPEFKSRPNRPHPLFRDFIGAAAAFDQRKAASKLAPRQKNKGSYNTMALADYTPRHAQGGTPHSPGRHGRSPPPYST